MFLTLMRSFLVLFLVLWLKLVKDFLKVRFFFQAEDGIRGRDVTVVQTCALPISFPHEPATRPPGLTEQPGSGLTVMRTHTRGPNGCMRVLLRDVVRAFSSHDPAP